jgi:hypothetical protein
MKKLASILILVGAVFVGGCAKEMQTLSDAVSAAQNFKVTQGQVDAARNSYNGFVLGPLRKYSQLVRCKTGEKLTLNNPCHDRKLLKQIRTVDMQVEKAFSDTQNRIISGDNQGAVAAYTTLKGLIDIAKALIAQTGVAVLGV